VPRVDEGSYVVEVSSVFSLDREHIGVLVRWALSTGVFLVVEPTIAFVRAPSSHRVLPIAIGVGSLISRSEPPPVRYYVVERPFWASYWKVGLRKPSFRVLDGAKVALEGTIVSLDFRDPVALVVNGLSGVHVVNKVAMPNCTPLARLKDVVVLCRSGIEYITNLVEGEAAKRVEYMAMLASTASPGPATADVDN
jgi:hypothetical protein